MIEPFDQQRHEALLQESPIKPFAQDDLTHKLIWRDQRAKPLCEAAQGTRLSHDWRLVNCDACRGAGEAVAA